MSIFVYQSKKQIFEKQVHVPCFIRNAVFKQILKVKWLLLIKRFARDSCGGGGGCQDENILLKTLLSSQTSYSYSSTSVKAMFCYYNYSTSKHIFTFHKDLRSWDWMMGYSWTHERLEGATDFFIFSSISIFRRSESLISSSMRAFVTYLTLIDR